MDRNQIVENVTGFYEPSSDLYGPHCGQTKGGATGENLGEVDEMEDLPKTMTVTFSCNNETSIEQNGKDVHPGCGLIL